MPYLIMDNGVTRPATPAEIADIQSRTTPTPIVPAEVTMRQAQLALLQAGMLYDVEEAINAMASPQKEAAQIEWTRSAVVLRHSPMVAMLAGILTLTEAQLDSLFITASTL